MISRILLFLLRHRSIRRSLVAGRVKRTGESGSSAQAYYNELYLRTAGRVSPECLVKAMQDVFPHLYQ